MTARPESCLSLSFTAVKTAAAAVAAAAAWTAAPLKAPSICEAVQALPRPRRSDVGTAFHLSDSQTRRESTCGV